MKRKAEHACVGCRVVATGKPLNKASEKFEERGQKRHLAQCAGCQAAVRDLWMRPKP